MVISRVLHIRTSGDCDIVDITQDVVKAVSESNIADGMVTVFIMGSTAGITTIEFEPGLVSDLKTACYSEFVLFGAFRDLRNRQMSRPKPMVSAARNSTADIAS